MPVNVTCPNCNNALRVADRFLGVRVKCKFCGQPILIEVQAEPAAGPPPDAPEGNVFEQMTLVGPAPVSPGVFDRQTVAPAPTAAAPAGSGVFGRQTLAAEPPADGPPPLPPRPPGPPKVKIGALILSILSTAVICGSVAAIVMFRPHVTPDPQAVAGEKYAAIALESGGVRFAMVPIEKRADGYSLGEWVLENREVKLAPDKGAKRLDEEKLREGMKRVQELAAKAREAGVTNDRLFVLCNSGVLSGLDAADQEAARRELDDLVRQTAGVAPVYVDPDDEARYGALASVPPEDRTKAVYFDLGNSGARCGYHDAPGVFIGFKVPLGRKGFLGAVREQVKAQPRVGFAAVAEGLRGEALTAPLRAALKDRPPAVNRTKFYIAGGSAWAAAVLQHPDQLRRPHLTFAAGDFGEFDKAVRAAGPGTDGLRAKALNRVQGLPDRDRELAAGEIDDVTRNRFGGVEDLAAAAQVLRALSEVCRIDADKKEVKYYTNALYAWPLGFLLARSGAEK